MQTLRVGFIGTGRPWKTPGATGFGMAYAHAEGYGRLKDVEIVACADLKRRNAEAFAEKTGAKGIYTDYHAMLRDEKLDIVSVCTWPALHAAMVVDAAKAGVKAVHCEKPMADTWGGAQTMAAECAKRNVKLTFNHQRRFGEVFVKLRTMAWGGAFGRLLRMDAYPPNLYDWGTHWVDMLNMFNRETPPEWVIGQLDWRGGNRVFAAPCDTQGIFHVKYRNGVHAVVMTGNDRPDSCAIRLTGDAGTGEIHWSAPSLRVWKKGASGFEVADAEGFDRGPMVERAVADIVKAVRENGKSELCAENALRATEIIFAGYESSRRRARVDLPLTVKDNPLEAMIKSGAVKAQPKPKAAAKKK